MTPPEAGSVLPADKASKQWRFVTKRRSQVRDLLRTWCLRSIGTTDHPLHLRLVANSSRARLLLLEQLRERGAIASGRSRQAAAIGVPLPFGVHGPECHRQQSGRPERELRCARQR